MTEIKITKRGKKNLIEVQINEVIVLITPKSDSKFTIITLTKEVNQGQSPKESMTPEMTEAYALNEERNQNKRKNQGQRLK